MPLQIRTVDGSLLSPDRDIRYCYPQVIEKTVQRFNNNAWPELKQVVENAGGTWDGLCDAMVSIATFLASPIEDPGQEMKDAMAKAGWFNMHPADQAGVLAMMGTVLIGQLYYAICETTPLGAPPEGMAILMEKCIIAMNASRMPSPPPPPVVIVHNSSEPLEKKGVGAWIKRKVKAWIAAAEEMTRPQPTQPS